MNRSVLLIASVCSVVIACGPGNRNGNGSGSDVDGGSNSGDGGQQGCGGLTNCFSVYAHSNDTLYVVDLQTKTLQTIGKFNTSTHENITDLAVAPDDTIYVISNTTLFTADKTTGATTKVGSLSACGSQGVALTTMPNGDIWEGDFSGKLCKIDISSMPPTVGAPVTMSNNLALSGDLVAVDDGTVFGTAYKLSDGSGMGTQLSNVLVTIQVATGATTMVGATGFPKLFGVSYALGSVIGFTHDGTGHVIQIDRMTGTATMFATFMDPSTNQPISFAGAGVNSKVSVIQ